MNSILQNIKGIDEEESEMRFRMQAKLYRGEFGPNMTTTFVKKIVK